ncbi:MAG: Tat pathway signal protein, partial [Gemmatimonadaceae bacterium]
MNRRQVLIGGGAVAAVGATMTFVGMRQMGSASEYDDAARTIRARLAMQPEARDFIRFAALAPNGHNTQPWRFAIAPRRISVLPDFSRRTPVVDPDDHHIFVSLGCAAENLVIAAAARGYIGEPIFNSANDGSIEFAYGDAPPVASTLFDAISVRQSTRANYDGRAVSSADLKTLADASAVPGVATVLVTDRTQMDRIRDLVLTGTSAQMSDAAFVRELKSWLRFSPRQAERTGDGLYSVTTGNPALPDWLGALFFDLLVSAKSENEKYASQLRSSAGLAVFVGAEENREHWTRVGRACQRFA